MESSARNTKQTPCSLCGSPHTPWSVICQRCEGNRQRYLAATAKADFDRAFLIAVRVKGQSSVARERGVSRQAVHEMVRKAQIRIAFLTENPLPPMQASQDVAPVH